MFHDNGNTKLWKEIEFHLRDTHKIYWLQIIDALPKTRKDILFKDKGNTKNLVSFDHNMFQYKVLHNILYANKMLFKFGKVPSPRCKLHDETIMQLFCDRLIVKRIWNQLKFILSNNLIFPISTPQSAIFGFWDLDMNEHLILNHLLLIFKMYIYNARKAGSLNINHLLIYIKGIKDSEKKLCENDVKRRKKISKKWKNVLIN